MRYVPVSLAETKELGKGKDGSSAMAEDDAGQEEGKGEADGSGGLACHAVLHTLEPVPPSRHINDRPGYVGTRLFVCLVVGLIVCLSE